MIFIIKAQVSKTLSYEDKKNPINQSIKKKKKKSELYRVSEILIYPYPSTWGGWYSSSAGDLFLPQ